MQRISPLKAGLEAFNRFKTNSLQNNQNATNPFGISFKGSILQMDVFETSRKSSQGESESGFNKFISNAKMNAANAVQSAVSFGSKFKENVKSAFNKLASVEISFGNSYQKRATGELEEMFKAELNAMGV